MAHGPVPSRAVLGTPPALPLSWNAGGRAWALVNAAGHP
jgi:hypothetical protein